MLKLMSFGSGSCGNCYYICTRKRGILIDAGIGIRKMKKYFSDYGLSFDDVEGIIVTHDHADHVKTVGVLSGAYNLPVYATGKVHEGIRRNYCVHKKVAADNVRLIEKGEEFVLGGFNITAFDVPHDSLDNVGFMIKCGESVLCLMTDIGHVTDGMSQAISQADYLVIEANYDEEMLLAGPYPEYLKKRVSGGMGHLSNKQCACAIKDYATDRLRHVWLCHLSEENNHPELARKTVETMIPKFGDEGQGGICVDVFRRNVPSLMFELE